MRRETLIAASVFAAIPLVILGFAIMVTWALAQGASPAWRLPFRLVCHGMAARCLSLWDTPMPLCARCTGIYAGLFAGLAAFFAVPGIGERWMRIAVVLAGGLMALDGLTQLARLRESTNELRIATGLAAGFSFGAWVLAAIERRERRGGSSFTDP